MDLDFARPVNEGAKGLTPYAITRQWRAPEVVLGMMYNEAGKHGNAAMQLDQIQWIDLGLCDIQLDVRPSAF